MLHSRYFFYSVCREEVKLKQFIILCFFPPMIHHCIIGFFYLKFGTTDDHGMLVMRMWQNLNLCLIDRLNGFLR